MLEYDDRAYIQDAAIAQEDPAHLLSAEREFPGRPAVDLLFVAAFRVWGQSPAAYHMLTVGLHLVASVLLAYTLRQLGVDLWLSFLSTVLFLLNVAHFRAIHWISSLAYPLGLIFALCLIICHNRFLICGRRRWLVASVAWAILAPCSHPGTVSVMALIAYRAWRGSRDLRKTLTSSWIPATAACAAALLVYLLYPQAPQVSVVRENPGIGRTLAYFLWFWCRLLTTAHWLPNRLKGEPEAWELAVGFLFCLGCIVISVRKGGSVSDWAVWTAVTMLPFLGNPNWLVFPSRYLYLPSVGTSYILAYLLQSLTRKVIARKGATQGLFVLGLTLIVILCASAYSLKRSEALSFYISGRSYLTRGDDETGIQLLERAVTHAPGVVPADAYTRLVVRALGYGESYRHILERALAEDPLSPRLRMLLGVSALLERGAENRKDSEDRITKAYETAEDKAQFRYDTALAYQNLGFYYSGEECFDIAQQLYARALHWRPDYPVALSNLGNLLYGRGRLSEAAQTYELLVEADSSKAPAWSLLATLRRQTGRLDGAHSAILRAIRIDPSREDYWIEYGSIGALYHTGGQTDVACAIYEEVLEAVPNLATTHLNLGILLHDQGHYARAAACFERVIQLSPRRWEGHQALAETYEMLDRAEEALREYRRSLSINPDNAEGRRKMEALAEKHPLLP